ncbi:MAG: hypothetical protein WDN75_04120 [Bacteroidota bacterium]
MAKAIRMASMDFYRDNTNLKWIILPYRFVISVGTIYYTNILVDQLKEREKNQVSLFAKALEYTPMILTTISYSLQKRSFTRTTRSQPCWWTKKITL